jgi:accessory colonization factor AcfC
MCASSSEISYISAGAEYVLDDAQVRGTVAAESRISLGLRRSVIIVPNGNPKGISSLKDLCAEEVRIGIAMERCLKALWDDVASKARMTDRIRRNITHHANSCGTVMALINMRQVDAIFGWNAFPKIWPDSCEAIEIPTNLQVFRSTAAARITYCRHQETADMLLAFLLRSDSKRIYSEYGWISP